MKIIILPLIITVTPVLVLFLFLSFWPKYRAMSNLSKVITGLIFVAIGMLASIYATIISVSGIAENGISCATGAVIFLALGFILNFAGVPLLLIFFRNTGTGMH